MKPTSRKAQPMNYDLSGKQPHGKRRVQSMTSNSGFAIPLCSRFQWTDKQEVVSDLTLIAQYTTFLAIKIDIGY